MFLDKKMYLDDLRTPIEKFDFIARSYEEAIEIIKKNGVANFISFDHDLGVDTDGKLLKNGYDLVKWIIKKDLNNIYKIPSNFTYKVHSQNPVGKKNIILLLDSYLKHRMKKNFYKNYKKIHNKIIFRRWLKTNIGRFNHKPFSNKKGGFYIENVIESITLDIDFNQPEAMLSFNNETFDYHSIQYIGLLKYDSNKGFYDADRVDNIYNYYPTYKELIYREIFEEIINYFNANFKDTNSLYLIDYGGVSEGFIASSDDKQMVKLQKTLNKDNIFIDKKSMFK